MGGHASSKVPTMGGAQLWLMTTTKGGVHKKGSRVSWAVSLFFYCLFFFFATLQV
ncbi:hypothetical protein L208DRAFT_1418921 [Tricholoma matsutake]|nr:hypothetical protein L208DRAFT_1419775 [Tricholoma matsutake 945]KAF8219065.1 hypothetical protein L208DRAFT_1418921 [Tricholoma matsutake 945]